MGSFNGNQRKKKMESASRVNIAHFPSNVLEEAMAQFLLSFPVYGLNRIINWNLQPWVMADI